MKSCFELHNEVLCIYLPKICNRVWQVTYSESATTCCFLFDSFYLHYSFCYNN